MVYLRHNDANSAHMAASDFSPYGHLTSEYSSSATEIDIGIIKRSMSFLDEVASPGLCCDQPLPCIVAELGIADAITKQIATVVNDFFHPTLYQLR